MAKKKRESTNQDISFEGNFNEIDHLPTGILTLDKALSSKGSMGMPVRSIYEISGLTHVGKSTLAYFLASRMPNSNIAVCDLEGFDPEYMEECLKSAGYKGTVRITDSVDEKSRKPRQHAEMLQETVTLLGTDPTYNSVIWDSVGATVPMVEDQGDFEEAFMGKRAKLVGQVSRRVTGYLISKEQPAIFIAVNHQQPVLGGQGVTTPGGVSMKFLAGVRIAVWNKETIKQKIKDEERILGYQIEGKVDKLRYGGKGRRFSVVNLSGYGINLDLSAMFDCFVLKLATRSTTVKIGKESVGFISKLFDAALDGKHEKFEPFYEALNDFRNSTPIEVDESSDGEPELSDEEDQDATVDE